ncbi:MAG: ABC transporter permease [Chitinispirillia bacterium]|nr:ABC transporter permease [Chitinispirillia bacterium]MCL2267883.1 ABC transporter permease [Chitinispirillia bacterium]
MATNTDSYGVVNRRAGGVPVTRGLIWFFLGAWARIVDVFRMLSSMAELLFDTFYAAVRRGRTPNLSLMSQINRQILYTGVEAFWLVGSIALLCGSAIVLVAMLNMPRFGVGEYFSKILVIVVVGELAPFAASLVVVGRSGTALAAYIGTMRVSREVDALEVMGIDPIQFIVQPAFVGIVVSVVCLNVYFITIAILGGLTLAQFTTGTPVGIFFGNMLEALQFKDVAFTLIKSVAFGLIVALVSSWHGLQVRNIRGVPMAAINAVVGSMFFTIAVNVILSLGYYAL